MTKTNLTETLDNLALLSLVEPENQDEVSEFLEWLSEGVDWSQVSVPSCNLIVASKSKMIIGSLSEDGQSKYPTGLDLDTVAICLMHRDRPNKTPIEHFLYYRARRMPYLIQSMTLSLSVK